MANMFMEGDFVRVTYPKTSLSFTGQIVLAEGRLLHISQKSIDFPQINAFQCTSGGVTYRGPEGALVIIRIKEHQSE